MCTHRKNMLKSFCKCHQNCKKLSPIQINYSVAHLVDCYNFNTSQKGNMSGRVWEHTFAPSTGSRSKQISVSLRTVWPISSSRPARARQSDEGGLFIERCKVLNKSLSNSVQQYIKKEILRPIRSISRNKKKIKVHNLETQRDNSARQPLAALAEDLGSLPSTHNCL